MKGVDVVVDVLFACSDEVPAIVEINAVAILEIEAQTQIGIAARKELGKGVVLGKEQLYWLCHSYTITHICEVGTVGYASQRQVNFSIGGQPVMCLILVVGEVAFDFPNEAKIAEHRKIGRSVLQAGDLTDVDKGIDIATDPLVPSAALRVVDAIEEVIVDIVVDASASGVFQSGVNGAELKICLIALPSVGDARGLNV